MIQYFLFIYYIIYNKYNVISFINSFSATARQPFLPEVPRFSMNIDHIPRFFVNSVLGPQCHTIPQMKDENLYFNQKIFKNS